MLALLLALSLHGTPTVIKRSMSVRDLRDTTHNVVVIHYDSGGSIASVIRYLRKRHASYNYIIDRNGKIIETVDPRFKANHAGISRFDGLYALNWYSIGICLHNSPPQPYTAAQYTSLAWLVKRLQHRWPDITQDRIVGHETVAFPFGRKHDPGKQFEWPRLYTLLDK